MNSSKMHYLLDMTFSDDVDVELIYKININGSGFEKLAIPKLSSFNSEVAQRRLAQASRCEGAIFIFLFKSGIPIGFCIFLLFEGIPEFRGNKYFQFSIDYVFMDPDERRNGYSNFLSVAMVEMVASHVKNIKANFYYDASEIVSYEGSYFINKIRLALENLDIFSV